MREDPSTASFEAFVAGRGPALLRTAFLLTGDHGRAEDLVLLGDLRVHPVGEA